MSTQKLHQFYTQIPQESQVIVHPRLSLNDIKGQPPVWSVIRLDEMWLVRMMHSEALIHKVRTQGRHLVWHIGPSMSAFWPARLSCSFGGKPTPLWQNWQHDRSQVQPALKSNPPNVYKMSLCPKTSSHTQTCLNFRAVCLWEDSIWQAKSKWERGFRRGLKPLRDRYLCGTSAVAERWIIWGCLRISGDELGCSEHEYHLREVSINCRLYVLLLWLWICQVFCLINQ